MTRRERLEKLNDLVIDTAIEELEAGNVGVKDLNAIITLLKNNKVLDEHKELTESDIVDSLVEDIK
jgi:hypothetical protein